MKDRMIHAHMEVAEIYSKLSYAERLKVGAIIVKENRVISIGYNGTPAGWSNQCEDQVAFISSESTNEPYSKATKTKPEVIHAEANAIAKLARSSESGDGSVMFITHAPCIECAKLIYGAGINTVYYRNHYRNNDGINFLENCNVTIKQV